MEGDVDMDARHVLCLRAKANMYVMETDTMLRELERRKGASSTFQQRQQPRGWSG